MIRDISRSFIDQPRMSYRLLRKWAYAVKGFVFFQNAKSLSYTQTSAFAPGDSALADPENPLKAFFDSRQTGPGIWKWMHYFDIYHRHFSKFIGREVHVLEIGVYSGGSLEMWKSYFGAECRIYGVDIEEVCKVYENEHTKIFIGDQADRNFWKTFKEQVPYIDILIDDGGHAAPQQIATLEEMLPHIRPGGVYLCEDIQYTHNDFAVYMQGMILNLNTVNNESYDCMFATEFQSWIKSINFYPFVTVIEKAHEKVKQFSAPKHGTEWQPISM